MSEIFINALFLSFSEKEREQQTKSHWSSAVVEDCVTKSENDGRVKVVEASYLKGVSYPTVCEF